MSSRQDAIEFVEEEDDAIAAAPPPRRSTSAAARVATAARTSSAASPIFVLDDEAEDAAVASAASRPSKRARRDILSLPDDEEEAIHAVHAPSDDEVVFLRISHGVPGQAPSYRTCVICYDDSIPLWSATPICLRRAHFVCQACWAGHVAWLATPSNPPHCPLCAEAEASDRFRFIDVQALESAAEVVPVDPSHPGQAQLLSPDQLKLLREKVLLYSACDGEGEIVHCADSNCGFAWVHARDDLKAARACGDGVHRTVVCPACHKSMCAKCLQAWAGPHEGVSCAVFRSTLAANVGGLTQLGVKVCPKCGAGLTHYYRDGCHTVRCPGCRTLVCFMCCAVSDHGKPVVVDGKAVKGTGCKCPPWCTPSRDCGCPEPPAAAPAAGGAAAAALGNAAAALAQQMQQMQAQIMLMGDMFGGPPLPGPGAAWDDDEDYGDDDEDYDDGFEDFFGAGFDMGAMSGEDDEDEDDEYDGYELEHAQPHNAPAGAKAAPRAKAAPVRKAPAPAKKPAKPAPRAAAAVRQRAPVRAAAPPARPVYTAAPAGRATYTVAAAAVAMPAAPTAGAKRSRAQAAVRTYNAAQAVRVPSVPNRAKAQAAAEAVARATIQRGHDVVGVPSLAGPPSASKLPAAPAAAASSASKSPAPRAAPAVPAAPPAAPPPRDIKPVISNAMKPDPGAMPPRSSK